MGLRERRWKTSNGTLTNCGRRRRGSYFHETRSRGPGPSSPGNGSIRSRGPSSTASAHALDAPLVSVLRNGAAFLEESGGRHSITPVLTGRCMGSPLGTNVALSARGLIGGIQYRESSSDRTSPIGPCFRGRAPRSAVTSCCDDSQSRLSRERKEQCCVDPPLPRDCTVPRSGRAQARQARCGPGSVR